MIYILFLYFDPYIGQRKFRCVKHCNIKQVNLQCGTKRRSLRRLARKAKKNIVIAEFDIEVDPSRLSGTFMFNYGQNTLANAS